MKVLGLSGAMTPRSRALVLAETVLERIEEHEPRAELDLIDLAQYNLDICDGRPHDQYGEDTRAVVKRIEQADLFVVTTPVYQASFTGALKNVLDLVPPDAFRHKPVGLAACGGTFQHYLMIENQLKPIFGYFRSYVAPGYVYAQDHCFGPDKQIVDDDLTERLERLALELIRLHNMTNEADRGKR